MFGQRVVAMPCRTLALFCALLPLVGSGCLLPDKQVGGQELEQDPPDPCERYCDRVAVCLDEDELLCQEACPDEGLDASCRAAQLFVLSCLETSSCEEAESTEQECVDALATRAEACGA